MYIYIYVYSVHTDRYLEAPCHLFLLCVFGRHSLCYTHGLCNKESLRAIWGTLAANVEFWSQGHHASEDWNIFKKWGQEQQWGSHCFTFSLQSTSYGQTLVQRPHLPTVDFEICLAGAPTQISKVFASEAKAAADAWGATSVKPLLSNDPWMRQILKHLAQHRLSVLQIC